MGRRGYNQVCQIFLLRLKLDCKCCFNVFKKISFFFLCLYFITGRITIIACVYFARQKCQGRPHWGVLTLAITFLLAKTSNELK